MFTMICSMFWETLTVRCIVILNGLLCAWLSPALEIFDCLGESRHFADVKLVD